MVATTRREIVTGRRESDGKTAASRCNEWLRLALTLWPMTKDTHERHRGGKIAEEPLGPSGNPWSEDEYAAMDAAFRGAMLDAIERGKEHVPEPPRRSRS